MDSSTVGNLTGGNPWPKGSVEAADKALLSRLNQGRRALIADGSLVHDTICLPTHQLFVSGSLVRHISLRCRFHPFWYGNYALLSTSA